MKLTQGESPSFMTLDQDPRNNVQILLDTDTHARFAMQEGVIIRNRLNRAKDAYRHTMLDKDGLDGVSNGVNLRLVLILE